MTHHVQTQEFSNLTKKVEDQKYGGTYVKGMAHFPTLAYEIKNHFNLDVIHKDRIANCRWITINAELFFKIFQLDIITMPPSLRLIFNEYLKEENISMDINDNLKLIYLFTV